MTETLWTRWTVIVQRPSWRTWDQRDPTATQTPRIRTAGAVEAPMDEEPTP